MGEKDSGKPSVSSKSAALRGGQGDEIAATGRPAGTFRYCQGSGRSAGWFACLLKPANQPAETLGLESLQIEL